MASFQQDVGGVNFPFQPFNVPGPDNSKATLIKTLGNLGLDAFQGHIENQLVGPTQADDVFDPVPVGVGEEGGVVSERNDAQITQALSDDNLNLRRIALAREQGVITAGAAKTMANVAVQRAIARMPGRAEEFRRKASTFFGDFGEGQGLLKPTASEKQADEALQALRLTAARDGFIGDDQVAVYQEIITNDFIDKVRANQLERSIKLGAARASEITEYAQNVLNQQLLGFLGQINGELSANDGLISKPEEFNVRLQGLVIASKQQLRQLYAQNGNIAQGDRDAGLASIDTMVAPITQMIKDGNMHTIMQSRAGTIQNLIKSYGSQMFPMMAISNAAGGVPGVEFYLNTLQKLENMTPERLKTHLGAFPQDAVFYSKMDMMKDTIQGLQDSIDGFIPNLQSDPKRRAFMADASLYDLRKGDPADQNRAATSLQNLRQMSNEGQKETLDALTDPSVKSRMGPAVRKESLNWVRSNLQGIQDLTGPQALVSDDRNALVFENGQWKVVPIEAPRRGPRGRLVGATPSQDLVDVAQELNRNMAVLANFQDTPEYQADEQFGGMDAARVTGEIVLKMEAKAKGIVSREAQVDLEAAITEIDRLAEAAVQGGRGGAGAKAKLMKKIQEVAVLAVPEGDPENPEQLKPGLYRDEGGDIFRVTEAGAVIEELNIGTEDETNR